MRAWRFSDIGKVLKNSLVAVVTSDFLLKLNVGKYFVHILYTFFLFIIIIGVSLRVEGTMAKVESNKQILRELSIENAQLTYEVAKAERRSVVASRLEALGSRLQEPQSPANELRK